MSSKNLPILALVPVTTEGLSLTPELVDDGLIVRLKGNADSTVNDAFAAFITRLHAEAQRVKAANVRVDLTELYFMTSSSIRCFVTWIGFIREAPFAQRYSLTFVVNPALRWQKRNLDILVQLSPDLVTFNESTA